jgi:hypothetical protein
VAMLMALLLAIYVGAASALPGPPSVQHRKHR